MNEVASAASAPLVSVSGQQMLQVLQAMLSTLAAGVLLPALLLVVLLGVAFWVIWLAQQREDFDVVDLLRSWDPNTGQWRVDTLKFCTLMGFAVHSAYFYATLWSSVPNTDAFLWYGVIWAGSPAAFELAQAAKQWNGQLPFAKGKE